MTVPAFPDRARVDAHEKVIGKAPYAADVMIPGTLFAMMVPATIAKGRIAGLSTEAAMRVSGMTRIFTADDFSPPPPPTPGGPPPPPPLIISEIAYRGQPVALVVAETLEAAIEGAEAIRPTYEEASSFSSRIDSAGAKQEPVKPVSAGDADAAMARAAARHKAEYISPAQHHNPMEMLSTTAVWTDGQLTIYEGTQGANGIKGNVARALGLDPAKIVVKSPQVGGGFGQKGAGQRQTAIVAKAAMVLGKPVKLVLPRAQIFHNATFRPLSRHRVEIGADAEGKMIAVRYDADHQQSRVGRFPPSYHSGLAQMYGIANYHGTAADIRIDTQSPGYMRSPHPHPGCFAFESAVDELAAKLGEDPVAFRLKHDSKVDAFTGHPLSSCYLNECIIEGARRFGWDRRSAAPSVPT